MLLRSLAISVAAGRVLYGGALAVAPRVFAEPWIGSSAGEPRTQIMVRGFAMRDLVLGAGSLWAVRAADPEAARWWFAAQAVSDATDLVGTLAAGQALPSPVRLGVAALAAGAAAVNGASAARPAAASR